MFLNRYHYHFCPLLRLEINSTLGILIQREYSRNYLLLSFVVYRLTSVSLIQAMDLFSEGPRSSRSHMFNIGVLKIFENFTRKHLRWSLFE